jgi:sirohydrochlorin cobaltochelatase
MHVNANRLSAQKSSMQPLLHAVYLGLLLLPFSPAHAAEPPRFGGVAEPPRFGNTLGEKAFGVLLLGEGGDRDWKATVDAVKKKAGNKYPLEFAPGQADGRTMQRAIDALDRQRARVIVIVPLFVSSYGEVMDQNKYLLGIRDKPSETLLKGPQGRMPKAPARLRSRVPLILTKALDDHPLFVELMAARAQSLSRKPADESIVLVGEAPLDVAERKEWLEAATGLAEKVRQKGGFKAARAFALETGRQKEREASAGALRAIVRDLRRDGKVLVVPLALTGKSMRLPSVLDGLFARYDGRTVLPDPRIERWVEESATAAAKLPDMRMFKDAAKGGILPLGMTRPAMTRDAMPTPPSLHQGDKQ